MMFFKCLASELGGRIINCCKINYPKTERLKAVSVGQKSRHISAGRLQLKFCLEFAFKLLVGAAVIISKLDGTERSTSRLTHIAVPRIQFPASCCTQASVSSYMVRSIRLLTKWQLASPSTRDPRKSTCPRRKSVIL